MDQVLALNGVAYRKYNFFKPSATKLRYPDMPHKPASLSDGSKLLKEPCPQPQLSSLYSIFSYVLGSHFTEVTEETTALGPASDKIISLSRLVRLQPRGPRRCLASLSALFAPDFWPQPEPGAYL
ncbi:hypothetical protein CEXT_649191 [Caerostris extrusa]|uniref:Uncharacterized protein n=1 Tax=Caerostris extrusa TaxID=172846 RepID=A0AAV4NQ12_CAEEX|nr:hypothetical protein CEXT_649191 [Caerostris extrusa]